MDTVLTRDGFLNLRYAASEEVQGKKKKPKTNKKASNNNNNKNQTACFELETEMVFDQNNMFGNLDQSWIPSTSNILAS